MGEERLKVWGFFQKNLEKQPQTSCCISEATHFRYHDLKSAQPSSLLRSESQVSWLGLLLASLISVTPHLKPVFGFTGSFREKTSIATA
ncbi:hypothetical protein C7B76_00595 [filamentous cyanobacterium CCP2]|nr:hypothetical protein C7B76_00595 [filamentous cyanobacterium CCP2]